MTHSRRIGVLVAVCVALAVAAPNAQTLSSAVKSEVIDRTAAALVSTYIEIDGGQAIAEALRQKLASGAYDTFTNPAQFAEAVTADMRRRNGDLHLGLTFAPPGAAGAPAAPPVSPATRNFGLGSVAILEGNVGYLEVTGFTAGPGYRAVVDEALRFLERTDAIIIDVRRNGGGSSEMSHYLFSHFFEATPRPTIRVMRREQEPTTAMSHGTVGGPRRTDVPLYVLTSAGTASAAEEFSFVLRNQKRATIVGNRTAGAGRMVTSVPVGHGFTARISITRVFDASTGVEWEREGIEPHVAVAPEAALEAAHEAALVKLNEGNPDATRTLLIETLRAQRQPVAVASTVLAGFTGTYSDRVVTLADGSLKYTRRAGGLPERLVPLGGGRFALGAVRFVFESTAAGVRLTITQPNGTAVTFDRSR